MLDRSLILTVLDTGRSKTVVLGSSEPDEILVSVLRVP